MSLIDLQVLHVMKLANEFSGDQLLDETLAGEPRSAENVAAIYRFIVQHFGRDTESPVTMKFWLACGTYLATVGGYTREQLQEVRRPYPRPGEPGYTSILDELYEEGHDVPEHLLSPSTKRRSTT